MTNERAVDCFVDHDIERLQMSAKESEAAGFRGGWIAENAHDAFVASMRAIDATTDLQVGTSVAVAFARNPMSVAYAANDLQLASKGRFMLGLGAQIRQHIEQRFAMPWSEPANRMREFIQAVRCIWSGWNGGGRLDFDGRFYRHTLMTPVFDPGPNPYGPPPIFVAGVGPLMTEVAAEVADGFIVHALSTPDYFEAVTRPALDRGCERGQRSMDAFTVSWQAFVVTGSTTAEFMAAETATRAQIAFYGSTPGYRDVLRLHGWVKVAGER